MVTVATFALLLAAGGCAPGEGGADGVSGQEAAGPAVGVRARGPTYEARLEAAWAAAPAVRLSEGGSRAVALAGGPVVVDVPDRIEGLPEGTRAIDVRTPEVLTTLLGTDERAAALALRESGAMLVVVHAALRPSVDRDRRVLSRLYHHDALDHFQLVRVEDGALVYLVADAPPSLPPEVASTAIGWLRERLAGRAPKAYSAVRAERGTWRILASVRGHGRELAFGNGEAETLDVALEEVAVELEAMHRREREALGFPPLREHVADMTFDLHQVVERAFVVPRDVANLEEIWDPGLDGAWLLGAGGVPEGSPGERTTHEGTWPGSVAVGRGIGGGDAFLRGLALESGWDDARLWRDPGTQLYLLRTQHCGEVQGKGVVPLYRGTSPVPLDFVGPDTTRAAILHAGEWVLANQRADGEVACEVLPEESGVVDGCAPVTHALAARVLAAAWSVDPRPAFLEGAIRARGAALRAVREEDGVAFLAGSGPAEADATAEVLLATLEVARALGDRTHDERLRAFGRFLLRTQAPSGAFSGAWEGGRAVERPDGPLSGEAAVALVALAEHLDDPAWLEPLPRFFAHARGRFGTLAADRHEDAAWPAGLYDVDTRRALLRDAPALAVAAAAYTRARPDAADVADLGVDVGRWIVASASWTAERAPFPDYVGGAFTEEGEEPGADALPYGEATAAAYAIALRAAPEEAPALQRQARAAVRFAFQLQHDALDARAFARPALALGGVRHALDAPRVRVEAVHAAVAAMSAWLRAAEGDPALAAELRRDADPAVAAMARLWGLPSVPE